MSELAAEQLPDDVDALKALLLQKQQRIRLLEEQILLMQDKRFASSSEQAPGQLGFFDEAESEADEKGPEPSASESVTYTRKKASGRQPIPADLPRARREYDLSEEEKACNCGCQMQEIGEEVSEQLDIIPAKIQVIQHVRKKYACKACESGVKTAPLPAQPIPKSNASLGLLAQITVAKYQDALPLARQEKIFRRIGVDLPRNTLASWIIRCGQLAQPLLNLLEDRLREGPIIQCDETPVQVLKEPDKPPESQSYMWVRLGGPPNEQVVLYAYHPSRSGEVARTLLSDFSGYLQTDDYAGYHAVGAATAITHLGCWAHARRKFIEAQKVASSKSKKTKDKSKKNQPSKADIALNYIGHLYGIERRGKDLSPEERHQLRQTESLPVLDKLQNWLDKTLLKVLPKSTLGKTLSYLRKNWEKLCVYVEDGRLSIDNNAAENAIRPFVIGRKNWLFSDTPKGAKASAGLYSLIETAKANGLEPYDYLRHVYAELPQAETVEDIEALLPWNARAAELSEKRVQSEGGGD
ncbi:MULTISPECIES: IS66 family transposase [unclassified Microbulbifer]|uniref:IS66 family transposase n=1 Tax=unclassified Microbulbifer TaxID=2619833 RepID=UPI0027E431FC|nr:MULTISPECIES: IS66 family transposase [unclassified Microbulbifer]